MSNTDLKKTIFAMPLIVAIAGVAGINQAHAYAVSGVYQGCEGDDPSYDISGNVSTASDCAILLPLSTSPVVNDDADLVNGLDASSTNFGYGFFGLTDWLYDGKLEENGEPAGEPSVLFNFSTTLEGSDDGSYKTNGTYTYDSTGASAITDGLAEGESIADIMFVFKDGNGTNLVGYLLGMDTGTYENMFLNPPFPGGSSGDAIGDKISHISVYYRTEEGSTPPEEELPAPGTLLLLSGALVGLAATRRRRK